LLHWILQPKINKTGIFKNILIYDFVWILVKVKQILKNPEKVTQSKGLGVKQISSGQKRVILGSSSLLKEGWSVQVGVAVDLCSFCKFLLHSLR